MIDRSYRKYFKIWSVACSLMNREALVAARDETEYFLDIYPNSYWVDKRLLRLAIVNAEIAKRCYNQRVWFELCWQIAIEYKTSLVINGKATGELW